MSVAVIVGLLALVCVFAIMIVAADEYTRNTSHGKVHWLYHQQINVPLIACNANDNP